MHATVSVPVRQYAAESPTKSPLQQATEAAAKKLADADKPQAAAPAAAAPGGGGAAAADAPNKAAAAAAPPGTTLSETEATPSTQEGPGEALLLQENLCKQGCLVTDLTISLTISTVSW